MEPQVETLRNRTLAIALVMVASLAVPAAPALAAGGTSWTQPPGPGTRPMPGAGEAAEEAAAHEAASPSTVYTSTALSEDVVTIRGAGWGHGIGMSQYGAYARALDGQTYDQILAAYYQGTTVGADPGTAPLWVNLESEAVQVILQAKAISTPATPVTITRDDTDTVHHGDLDTTTLADGDTVTIRHVDTAGPGSDPRRCTFTTSTGFDAGVGSCNIELTWDGTAPAPTMRVVIDKVWYADTDPAGPGIDCTHRLGSLVLDCAYAYGQMHIRPDDWNEPPPGDIGFHVVQEMDIEHYLYGIGEMPYGWPQAALRVQAVAARTFARSRVDGRAAPQDRPWCWCNLYDTSIDQVYLGWGFDQTANTGPVAANWVQAVDDTAGQVLLDGGSVIGAYYSSSNGGASENNEDIWGGTPISYLRSVADQWSLTPANPYADWSVEVPMASFAAHVGLDIVWSVKITDTYVSGTPSRIEVTGLVGDTVTTHTYTGVQFKTLFGLPSAHLGAVEALWPVVQVDRWWGQDRFETAVAISKQSFPSGADTVFVATGLNFPDALAAAPLARKQQGPVLLVRTDSVPPVTRREIVRLHPSRIVILGGPAAVSAAVADELAGSATVERLAGADRYETAVEISKATFPTGAPVVYLATGWSFEDAVSGGPIAAVDGGPLLLTKPDRLTPVTREEIRRLAPRKVVVLGAGTSIADSVVADVGRYVPTVIEVRGSGPLIRSAATSAQGFASGAPVAFLGTVETFPDALTAGQAAASLGGPVLLTDPQHLDAATKDELVRLTPRRVVLLGGTAAVSSAIVDEVKLALQR